MLEYLKRTSNSRLSVEKSEERSFEQGIRIVGYWIRKTAEGRVRVRPIPQRFERFRRVVGEMMKGLLARARRYRLIRKLFGGGVIKHRFGAVDSPRRECLKLRERLFSERNILIKETEALRSKLEG